MVTVLRFEGLCKLLHFVLLGLLQTASCSTGNITEVTYRLDMPAKVRMHYVFHAPLLATSSSASVRTSFTH